MTSQKNHLIFLHIQSGFPISKPYHFESKLKTLEKFPEKKIQKLWVPMVILGSHLSGSLRGFPHLWYDPLGESLHWLSFPNFQSLTISQLLMGPKPQSNWLIIWSGNKKKTVDFFENHKEKDGKYDVLERHFLLSKVVYIVFSKLLVWIYDYYCNDPSFYDMLQRCQTSKAY